MSRELDHQYEWLRDLAFFDPHWADTEFRMREQAVGIVESLTARVYGNDRSVRLSTAQPSSAIASFIGGSAPHVQQHFNEARFEVYPVGGKEEVLLVEECLRRVNMGVGW